MHSCPSACFTPTCVAPPQILANARDQTLVHNITAGKGTLLVKQESHGRCNFLMAKYRDYNQLPQYLLAYTRRLTADAAERLSPGLCRLPQGSTERVCMRMLPLGRSVTTCPHGVANPRPRQKSNGDPTASSHLRCRADHQVHCRV